MCIRGKDLHIMLDVIPVFIPIMSVDCFSIALKKLNKFNLSAEIAETQFENFIARINFHFHLYQYLILGCKTLPHIIH